ncbi:barstar family protein [Paenibacillus sp. GYB004]|uniref:VOC family protein n=1 Tax=Paenibacillus sp. GYB004 TaxID=2994393 RepID=UPI002F965044
MNDQSLLIWNGRMELKRQPQVPNISRIIVATIPVRDVEQAKAWYSLHLGIDFDARKLHAGNLNIGFSKVENHSPSAHSIFIWQTSDLEHAYRSMKANGVTLHGEVNWVCRYFVFADCDGNRMTMWQQDEEAIFRLSAVQTAEELQDVIKRALFCRNSYGRTWSSFEEELLLCETIRGRKIVLDGWSRLLSVLPEEAHLLKECVKRHNAKYPSHEWLLEARN